MQLDMSSETGREYLRSSAKRNLDLVGGAIIGLALSPAITAAAVLSAVDSRTCNPILRQTRLGQEGRLFDVIKFRTLRKSSADGDMQTFGTFDPRATKIGSFMRKFGLDELPQIVNVLNGSMSLVGIRPLLAKDYERMAEVDRVLFDEWGEAYKDTKPGLTGPGQLYRHHFLASTDEVYAKSMRLDLEYVDRASLQHDISLLGQTPIKLLKANIHTIDNAQGAARSLQAATELP